MSGGRGMLSRWTAAQLEAGGWVRRMFTEGERLRALHGPDSVADLSLGQPLDEPADAVRAAIAAAAAERGAERFGYMPNLGFPEARARVAADAGVDVGPECIALTGGAGAAICLALRAFVDPGDEVVGVVPFFGEYRAYCASAGATWVTAASAPDHGLDLGALERALTPRTAAVILNTPCNPSGHVATAAELTGLAAVLEHHRRRHGRQVVLIVDEVYHRLVYPPSTHLHPFSVHPATVLARSFSKDLGLAGERIGYLALHPELATPEVMRGLELCQRALGFVNAPATMQRMLVHLPSLDVDLAPFQARRDLALELATDAGLEVADPQGGIYLWVRVPGGDALALASTLAQRRVLVAPGAAFGTAGWLRVCFTAPVPALRRGLGVIGECAAELDPTLEMTA
ncbi:MAG TPA: aminotransferase class I/II-fold pyridoxal phosphate-dependent enzyme [Candidatus Dormibacteraeota bacterium]|nr:aminotransferase class I/II-fold pyridoxal phosphate-dependent enzyme [Candidatus Dormibacteraeota bacterium]